jgi:hypothetical protein
MNDVKLAGRWIALALLAQLVAGPLINFGILATVFQDPPGFIVNAAPHAQDLALAVMLLLGMGAVSASIGIAAWPVLRRRSERMALWLVVLGAACLALAAVECAALMSTLSLSKAYAVAAGADPALYEGLRGVVAAGRNWAHYTHLICEGGLVFVLYTSLFRFRLVPRALAAFGMAAALTQMTAVSMPLFGQPIVFAMLAPLGIAHLALLTWLLLRGLREDGATRTD